VVERIAEQTAKLAVQASGESNAALQRSSGSLSAKEAREVAMLMGQMIAYYPHQEMGEETVQGYKHDLTRLAANYGLTTLKAALLNLRIRPGQKFFPHPSEVAEELEAMATKAKAQARAANPYVPDPQCKHVLPGQAWVIDKDGDRVIGECECHRRWRGTQAMNATRDNKAAAAGE
jgi:hypothetical protein